MAFGPNDVQALTKFVGLPVKLLLQGDGNVAVRIWHAHLTEAGEDGIKTLVAMRPYYVEVTYADEADAPLARAHETVLEGRGLEASACIV
ncbi:hypothetical protein M3795_25080 [Ralstonia pickettii]|uniref:hypothetical protein n=1 Tax=Ralstonia pickettii TaxID=329 RepID=UPI00203E004D|nr:hypothetical protein [Ralstonia pickettii]MCM3583747.1 hypothetical protein [Ralstonia pickettii]